MLSGAGAHLVFSGIESERDIKLEQVGKTKRDCECDDYFKIPH